MRLEKLLHVIHARALRVTMHQRKIDRYHFISQPIEVERVALLILVIRLYIVLYINSIAHLAKAAVAYQLHFALRLQMQSVIAFIQGQVSLNIHFAALYLTLFLFAEICVAQVERVVVLALLQLIQL